MALMMCVHEKKITCRGETGRQTQRSESVSAFVSCLSVRTRVRGTELQVGQPLKLGVIYNDTYLFGSFFSFAFFFPLSRRFLEIAIKPKIMK
jgi:hypothetical protein